jgi:hypothetical protein
MTDKEPEAAELYHDGNERDVQKKQEEPVAASEAIKQDPDVDASAIRVLPGTGGPDDVGDVELAPEDYNRNG